jgi:hypothetical protein
MMIDESKLPAPPFRIVLVSALEDLDAADTTVGSKKVASIVLDRDFPLSERLRNSEQNRKMRIQTGAIKPPRVLRRWRKRNIR